MLGIVLILLTLSCAKLPEAPTIEKGDLIKESVPHVDSIPFEWGPLVSVSSVPQFPTWVQLWCQDKEGNIRMLPYNIRTNKFWNEFTLVKRK